MTSTRLDPGDDWYRPSPFEVAAGWVHGIDRSAVVRSAGAGHPASVLRDLVRVIVAAGPCVIPFSGGRDSSLLLAVACDAAREAATPMPVALTFTYPDDPAADEDSWQEMVIDHLADHGMRPEWERVAVRDELDVVGPLVAPLLAQRRHPLWPPSIGATVAVVRRASGATVLSGEHGDEVFGMRRATLLSGVVRRRGRGLTAADRRAVAVAALPRAAVAAGLAAGASAPTWLQRRGRARWRRLSAGEALRDPLRWDTSLRRTLARNAVVRGTRTLTSISSGSGCRWESPFTDSRLIASLAAHGGARGLESRGAMVRLLAGDLLPEAVITRRTKASFGASRFHRHTRAVLAGPRRLGATEEWVVREVLDHEWSREEFAPGTAALVQQVWLEQQGMTS